MARNHRTREGFYPRGGLLARSYSAARLTKLVTSVRGILRPPWVDWEKVKIFQLGFSVPADREFSREPYAFPRARRCAPRMPAVPRSSKMHALLAMFGSVRGPSKFFSRTPASGCGGASVNWHPPSIISEGEVPSHVSFPQTLTGLNIMLRWILTFLVIALIAGVFGFTGVAGAATDVARILFYVFLVLLLIAIVAGLFRGSPPAP